MVDNGVRNYIKHNVLTTAEAAVIMQVSKARISKLVDDKLLIPVKSSPQGNLFLRQDIEAYRSNRQSGLKISDNQPLFDNLRNTTKSLNYYYEHRNKLGSVTSIFIFFDNFDAILNNFYRSSETDGYGELRFIYNPHFVIRDNSGKELWLSGCNCGYGGNGPGASATILKSLRQEGTLPEDPFTDNYIENLLYSKQISIIKDPDGNWDITTADSSFDILKLGAKLFSFRDNLVLVQDIQDYRISSHLELLATYQTFLPNPASIMVFTSDAQAEEQNYVLYRDFGQITKTIYNVIITDISGRQIWLRADDITGTKDLVSTASIINILRACGFPIDERPGGESRLLGKLTSWLNANFKKDPSKPVIYYKNS